MGEETQNGVNVQMACARLKRCGADGVLYAGLSLLPGGGFKKL
jgi:hypothetical protein